MPLVGLSGALTHRCACGRSADAARDAAASYRAPGAQSLLVVAAADLASVAEGEFLNDNVVDFGFQKLLQARASRSPSALGGWLAGLTQAARCLLACAGVAAGDAGACGAAQRAPVRTACARALQRAAAAVVREAQPVPQGGLVRWRRAVARTADALARAGVCAGADP